ncbi:unnamed protein product [Mesocestoides corti]|uniref:Cadherin domain-containing protein n=1 Tax=Mesocestoides corti TaxID=53468 RepID=A0A158QUT4_MESCO|nr:unnamed protein product [Mesocestoides corti]
MSFFLLIAQVPALSPKLNSLQHLTYFVSEEVPRGTRVGNVFNDIAEMLGTYTTTKDTLPVNLMVTNWQDLGPQHFAIDLTSGYLIVSSKLDRETLCPNSGVPVPSRVPYPNRGKGDSHSMPEKIHAPEAPDRPCSLTLRVVYTPENTEGDPEDPLLLTIRIIITDINDQVPTFPQTRINLELGEISAVPGETTINLPTASDSDAGSNGTLSYWLEHLIPPYGMQRFNSTEFPFRLEGLADGNPLRLRLIQPLDYENVKSYEFVLCVEDNGTPNPLSSRLGIHLDVLDENDNAPTFSKSNYFIIINESLPRGSVLLDLHAQDFDSGQNGYVSFELPIPMTEESKAIQQYFDVRTITPGYAKLFVRQSPDLDIGIEKQSDFRPAAPGVHLRRSRDFALRIVATDNGSPWRHTSEATVTIRVLDVNDMVPKISVNYLISPHVSQQIRNMLIGGPSLQKSHGVVMENVERSLVAFVTVHDVDSGPWGQVSCRTDNDAFKLVFIGGNGIEVETHEDNGEEEPLSANNGLSFKLMTQRAFDREEKQQVNFHIICVDNVFKTGQEQAFVQDLSPRDSGVLSGDDGTGSKPFTVVSDRAKQLTGTTLVSVRVLDENDCAPEFSQSLYTFSEEENVPDFANQPVAKGEGKSIGIIQAHDRDLNSMLTYTLLSVPQDAFQIDPQSGNLYIVRPFDREAFLTSSYEGVEVRRDPATNESIVVAHFLARVSDGKHSADTKIQVTIADVNDCPPVFEKNTYEFFVDENHRSLNGHPIGNVKAHDSDAGLKGKIIYRLQPVSDQMFSNSTNYLRDYNPNRHFKVDPNTGSISTLRPLDRERHIHHIFHVVAVDASGSPLYQKAINEKKGQFTATATVTVIVNDENDNAPSITFPAPHATLRVEAGTPAGQQIFTVTATDPDAAENGTVRYSLWQSTPPMAELRSQEAGAKSTIFAIDEQTGIVMLTEKLPSIPKKYLLTIGAHDLGGVIQRNTSITAIIHVMSRSNLDISKSYGPDSRALIVDPDDTDEHTLGGSLKRLQPPPGGPLRAHQHLLDGEAGDGHSEDSRLPPPPMPPFAFLTDRIIIFVLSSTFVVLLVVTVVLILLMRRRRLIEMSTNRHSKDGIKGWVQSIQSLRPTEFLPIPDPITQCGYFACTTGFARPYPVCAATHASGQQPAARSGQASSSATRLLSGLVTQPRKHTTNASAKGIDMSDYAKMPRQNQTIGDGAKCEYQILLQQKTPVCLQRRLSAAESVHGGKTINFPLPGDSWPSTSQEESEQSNPSFIQNVKLINGEQLFKSASLHPIVQDSSSDWNSDMEVTSASRSPPQPLKTVKFSTSSLPLSKQSTTGDCLSKTAEASYV